MKDFIKWLGVNEKIAKVVVWILIIMIMLIIVNAAMESVGFPHYAITYKNLIRIKDTKVLKYIASWIMTLTNFYVTIFLIFRIKEFKKIFKYSLIYLISNYIANIFFNFGMMQVFIVLFIIIFSYFYSNKNKKYILYAIIAIIFNTIIQGIVYTYRIKLIDYSQLGRTSRNIMAIDYFIIMVIIILVKEIYLKKRGDKND